MRLVISVPSGFHARELLIPLKSLFETDPQLEKIICITPGAPYRQQIFPDYSNKFEFMANPADDQGHEKLLNKAHPDLLITNTSGLDVRDVPILKAARNLKIPTLTFVASWDNVWKMERLKKYGKPQVVADTLIVWNTMMRDHLLRNFPEFDPQKIHIIGAPRLDFFFHHDKIPSAQALRDYLGIPHEGKLVHLATTELYPMDYLVKTIADAQQEKNLKDPIHLYASVHPGGDMSKHQPYAEKYGVTVRYSFGRQENAPDPSFRYNPSLQDIYMLVALFKHSALLVNHSSTVAIESFMADVPVINVKYGRALDWWRWYRSMVYRDFHQHYRDITADGATKVVTNPRQLIAAMNAYLTHPEEDHAARQQTLAKMITTTDGTASEKVFELIKQLTHD